MKLRTAIATATTAAVLATVGCRPRRRRRQLRSGDAHAGCGARGRAGTAGRGTPAARRGPGAAPSADPQGCGRA